jgi:hypothetical protein
MMIQAYLQALQDKLYGKSGYVEMPVEQLKEILEHIDSLERALADVLRMTYEKEPRKPLDTRSW